MFVILYTVFRANGFSSRDNTGLPFLNGHHKDMVLGRISNEISWDNILTYVHMIVFLLPGVVLSGGEPLLNDREEYIGDIKKL